MYFVPSCRGHAESAAEHVALFHYLQTIDDPSHDDHGFTVYTYSKGIHV